MDDDVASLRDAERPARDTGKRYDSETKERAYQLWAFRYGGNCERVAEAMAELIPPTILDGRIVRYWAQHYKWAIRRYQDWQQIAPDLVRTLGIDLTFGLLETAAEMRRLVSSTKTRIVTTISPSGSVRTEEKPEVSNSDRISAGKWIGDNYARLREIGALTQDAPAIEGGNETEDTSMDAVLERMRKRRERWS